MRLRGSLGLPTRDGRGGPDRPYYVLCPNIQSRLNVLWYNRTGVTLASCTVPRSLCAAPLPCAVALQVGSQTPIYMIQQEHSALRERNDQQRKRVDEVLTERLNLEAKAKHVSSTRRGRGESARAGPNT